MWTVNYLMNNFWEIVLWWHGYWTNGGISVVLQEPEATVKEFMTTNPILTEIEAQIRYYQVIVLNHTLRKVWDMVSNQIDCLKKGM